MLLKTTEDEWKQGPKPKPALDTDIFSPFVDLDVLHPSPYIIASDWKGEHAPPGGRHNLFRFFAIYSHIVALATESVKLVTDFGDNVIDAERIET